MYITKDTPTCLDDSTGEVYVVCDRCSTVGVADSEGYVSDFYGDYDGQLMCGSCQDRY